MADSSLERRGAKRVAVSIPVELRDGRGFSLHSTRDISSGGVFFDRAIPHSLGARVELSFTLPGDTRSIRCEGEVVNVPDAHEYGMGVRFLNLAPLDRKRIDDFAAELPEVQ
jgi:uncharacterized protein (TIGR02266 family)